MAPCCSDRRWQLAFAFRALIDVPEQIRVGIRPSRCCPHDGTSFTHGLFAARCSYPITSRLVHEVRSPDCRQCAMPRTYSQWQSNPLTTFRLNWLKLCGFPPAAGMVGACKLRWACCEDPRGGLWRTGFYLSVLPVADIATR